MDSQWSLAWGTASAERTGAERTGAERTGAERTGMETESQTSSFTGSLGRNQQLSTPDSILQTQSSLDLAWNAFSVHTGDSREPLSPSPSLRPTLTFRGRSDGEGVRGVPLVEPEPRLHTHASDPQF